MFRSSSRFRIRHHLATTRHHRESPSRATTLIRRTLIHRLRPRTWWCPSHPHQPLSNTISRFRLHGITPLVHETLSPHPLRQNKRPRQTRHPRNVLPPRPRPKTRHPTRSPDPDSRKQYRRPNLRFRESHFTIYRIPT